MTIFRRISRICEVGLSLEMVPNVRAWDARPEQPLGDGPEAAEGHAPTPLPGATELELDHRS